MQHGTDREHQRSNDYLRTEIMYFGEQLRAAEDRLAEASRRLDRLERILLGEVGAGNTVAKKVTEG